MNFSLPSVHNPQYSPTPTTNLSPPQQSVDTHMQQHATLLNNLLTHICYKCTHNKGLVCTLLQCVLLEMLLLTMNIIIVTSSNHLCTKEVSSLQRCPHYRGVLTTEVSSLQRCSHYTVSSLQRCPHYGGVLTTEVSSLLRCPHYRGVLTTEVSSLQRCPHHIRSYVHLP